MRNPTTDPETSTIIPEAPKWQLLQGEYAIETFLSETFLTAVGGGGRTSNAIHTNVITPGSNETFKLWHDPTVRINTPENPEGFFPYAVQTASGNYLTATSGGGQTSDVLHTDATQALGWETFGLIPQVPPFSIYPQQYALANDAPFYYAIATDKGNYLTALGGGGKTQDPTVHSDAKQIESWELFRLICKGELLPGYQYALRPLSGYGLFAVDGGGRNRQGVILATTDDLSKKSYEKFTLLLQEDGSYALQTLTGNYVTAVGGGGPYVDGTLEADVFHTDAVKIQSWEKFRIIDQGDFTYVIQTVFGWYVGVATPATAILRTDVTSVKDAVKFRLSPYLSEN